MFNILIVDDDEDDQLLLKMAFEKDSTRFRLQFALDGKDALEQIHGMKELPNLVLLDLNMPILNGFELLTYFRESTKYKHLPVVILTTSENEDDIYNAYKIGANTYIMTPIGNKSYVSLVEQIRQYWFTLAKCPTFRAN